MISALVHLSVVSLYFLVFLKLRGQGVKPENYAAIQTKYLVFSLLNYNTAFLRWLFTQVKTYLPTWQTPTSCMKQQQNKLVLWIDTTAFPSSNWLARFFSLSMQIFLLSVPQFKCFYWSTGCRGFPVTYLSLAHTQTAMPNKGTSVSMASQNHQWVACLCTIQFSFSVKSSNCEYQECHKMQSSFCLGYLQLHSQSRFAVIILCLVFRIQSRPFTLITYCSLEQSHFSVRFLTCHIHWCHKIDNKALTLNNNKLINVLLPRLSQIYEIVCYM